MSCCALVLAAGRSSRMGSPKALLPLDGRTFLDVMLDRLSRAAGVTGIGVVLGSDADELRAAIRFESALPIVNTQSGLGMFSSVRAGASALLRVEPGLTSVMVCLVDQPSVRVETYEALAAGPIAPREVRVASFRGAPGHPVRLGRAVVEAVSAAEVKGNRLDTFIARAALRRNVVETGDPAVLQNINTPWAYQLSARRFSPDP